MREKHDAVSGEIAVINVFTPNDGDVTSLYEMLLDTLRTLMGRRPGFLGARLHVALDGTRIANVGRWRSKEDLDAALAQHEVQERLALLRSRAQIEGGVYCQLDEIALPTGRG